MEEIKNIISSGNSYKRRGHLKIFFGYASGVGKTYAMLQAAHIAKCRGLDVVVGYLQNDLCPKTSELINGLEILPTLDINNNGISYKEFNIDKAIERKPQLILIDKLAHSNIAGCRHAKRYQDIEELLRAGIDVYTTVNVQDIESLNDTVTSITKILVQERIPDFIFDKSDQVELIDIEPQELIDRLKSGNISIDSQSKQDIEHFFTVEKLTALREIALRRCADRVNKITENSRIKNSADYHTDEHILVCLSSSPSNSKIIRTAARMASAFRGAFTALFVETSDFLSMSEEDKKRLRSNIHLAQQLGATIETTYGDDIPFQISEIARLSGVSKIVIRRSTITRKHLFRKQTLSEDLILNVPNVDVHIIPDNITDNPYHHKSKNNLKFSLFDTAKCATILLVASIIGFIFQDFNFGEANIITIYVLAVLIISIVTASQIYSLISSIISILIFNFLFAEPKLTFTAYEKGYPITFLIMFIAALLISSLANKLKSNARQSACSAFRTKVLFDTNQLLQQAKNKTEIVSLSAQQLIKLLNKDLIIYIAENGKLTDPLIFPTDEETSMEEYISEKEKSVAQWVYKNNKYAGATTQTFFNAKCLYLSIHINDSVYGVIGIVIGEHTIDSFENSIMLSILGECALTLENEKNAREKEEAAIIAKNEQLRANLLRAISHDLRTPLTSISGNASNLLSNGTYFDEDTKKSLYQDIYDESMWLIKLVENLLSVTRIEEGRLNLHLSAELVDEVIAEALLHVNYTRTNHTVTVDNEDEFLLAKMDARLIIQVIINLVDNAVKYTPNGSNITISSKKVGRQAVISIADNGIGISDENKSRVFDMFYSGSNKVADSHRSLGLGLALCKSIITAHGGTITVSDNTPHGAVFTFTLPIEEVKLHE